MATNEVFDDAGTLLTTTLQLVKDRDPLILHRETNIPYYWLRRFVVGGYRNPSVNRVQFLYEYLSGSKLL